MRSIKLCMVLLCILLLNMSTKKEERSLNIVFISGSNEYVSHSTLKEYKKTLEDTYSNVDVTILQSDGALNEKNEYSNLEGTDALKDCDVLLTFVRRTIISVKAIDDIKKYVASGKPVVVLRTSSHGFQSWPASYRKNRRGEEPVAWTREHKGSRVSLHRIGRCSGLEESGFCAAGYQRVVMGC